MKRFTWFMASMVLALLISNQSNAQDADLTFNVYEPNNENVYPGLLTPFVFDIKNEGSFSSNDELDYHIQIYRNNNVYKTLDFTADLGSGGLGAGQRKTFQKFIEIPKGIDKGFANIKFWHDLNPVLDEDNSNDTVIANIAVQNRQYWDLGMTNVAPNPDSLKGLQKDSTYRFKLSISNRGDTMPASEVSVLYESSYADTGQQNYFSFNDTFFYQEDTISPVDTVYPGDTHDVVVKAPVYQYLDTVTTQFCFETMLGSADTIAANNQFCRDYDIGVTPPDTSDDDDDTTNVVHEQQNPDQLRVYPNPAEDRLNLKYNLQEASKVTISIMDLTGQMVRKDKLGSFKTGNQRETLDINQLKQGLYFITIKTKNAQLTRKVVIE